MISIYEDNKLSNFPFSTTDEINQREGTTQMLELAVSLHFRAAVPLFSELTQNIIP
jgi:hypothetical protein